MTSDALETFSNYIESLCEFNFASLGVKSTTLENNVVAKDAG